MKVSDFNYQTSMILAKLFPVISYSALCRAESHNIYPLCRAESRCLNYCDRNMMEIIRGWKSNKKQFKSYAWCEYMKFVHLNEFSVHDPCSYKRCIT